MHVLEVRNAELIASLTQQAAEQNIIYAAIVALIGAVDGFTVSTNPAGDPTAHTYSHYPLPAEMTATGEIVDGKPHIHRRDGRPRRPDHRRAPAYGAPRHLVRPCLRDPLRAPGRRACARADRVRTVSG
ncbi:MAG: uncharacterized protein QOG79_1733 [Mycobacterium sp.]|jgi:hypothetical protein|nr:uncharacterized protein [Pseudonocardiales bacterium]MDT5298491.1 uncharacterized protein [Mycobacterium sp.]